MPSPGSLVPAPFHWLGKDNHPGRSDHRLLRPDGVGAGSGSALPHPGCIFPGMSNTAVYVASDAHLGAAPREMEDAFHAWLEFAAERAGFILINGDLFDFWFEWGSVVPRGHTRVLGMLARIVDAGLPVHLMGGNHDWWGGRYLTDEIGVVFHQAPVRLELAGRQTLVAHGDGLGNGDLGYRILKGILRSPVSRGAFRWLHPDLATGLARMVSRTHVERDGSSEAQSRRAQHLERWARDRLLESPELDLVLLGHTHDPARIEVAPGRFYLNSGDWLRNATYLVLDEGVAPRLESWT